MLSLLPEERVIIEQNSWENIGNPLDLRSPPQGKELEVSYHNGDYLHLKFSEVLDEIELQKKFNISPSVSFEFEFKFPITVVEINFAIGGTNINFSSKGTQAFGISAKKSVISHCNVGFSLNFGAEWQQNPKWKLEKKYEPRSGNLIKVAFGK